MRTATHDDFMQVVDVVVPTRVVYWAAMKPKDPPKQFLTVTVDVVPPAVVAPLLHMHGAL
jgi:hypothetical protein